MGVYAEAVQSVVCPRCGAAEGKPCKPTSSIVHPVRRIYAIDMGKWNPETAMQDHDLSGEPLEALKPR
jgi:hypothetical protein